MANDTAKHDKRPQSVSARAPLAAGYGRSKSSHFERRLPRPLS